MKSLVIYLCPVIGVIVIITTPGWIIGFLSEGMNSVLSNLGMLGVWLYGGFGIALGIGFWKVEKSDPAQESLIKVTNVSFGISILYLVPFILVLAKVIFLQAKYPTSRLYKLRVAALLSVIHLNVRNR
jgi:hypothetical protein